jgi:hypothetical protein
VDRATAAIPPIDGEDQPFCPLGGQEQDAKKWKAVFAMILLSLLKEQDAKKWEPVLHVDPALTL